MRLEDYPGLPGQGLNAIACVLIREAEEDLKPTSGGEAMNHEVETGIT